MRLGRAVVVRAPPRRISQGPLHNVDFLGDLTNLTYLDLAHNALNGTLPVQLGNLANVQAIHLESNALSGVIPSHLCAQPPPSPPPSFPPPPSPPSPPLRPLPRGVCPRRADSTLPFRPFVYPRPAKKGAHQLSGPRPRRRVRPRSRAAVSDAGLRQGANCLEPLAYP